MAKSLYLINPKSRGASYFGAEMFDHWGQPAAQSIADLATTTVAALAPADWRVTICEDYVEPVDFDNDSDFIGLTGKITQAPRMIEVAEEFRRRGKTVVIGGPYASLSPEAVRDHCDILVIGELEDIAEKFFGDLDRGTWKDEYVADKPDLSLSPLPRWDLYPTERALVGCVQTSRGCPFECEFCDVIQYLGRKQRHKEIDQILAELDTLYALGFREVFLADDNFTVYRKRAKAVMAALRDWNAARSEGPVAFSTQLSIDAARDPEIMRLLGEAGMSWVFIGIETPNEESLRETKKRQNVGIDLAQQVQVFLDHGIAVTGGMIVGFDHDGLDIFQRQYDFAMSTPIPFFSLGALVAPAATPLHDRMRESGRLLEADSEVAGNPWGTNIVPTQMTREQLFEGLKWLCNNLYRPEPFGQRVLQMIEALGPQIGPFKNGVTPGGRTHRRRPIELEAVTILRKVLTSGRAERKMYSEVMKAMAAKPETGPLVMRSLLAYAQIRSLYETGDFWEPRIGASDPFAGAASAGPPAQDGKGLVSIGG